MTRGPAARETEHVAALGGAAPLPASGGERVQALDAIRGVALLGILLVNAIALSGLSLVPHQRYLELPFAGLHVPLALAVIVLVEAKFYSMFSLLFGIGFAVFVGRAAARGADGLRLFRRRLAGLLLIGLGHTFFLWMGDILVTYAVLGFGLIPFMRQADRSVLRWAAVMLLAPIPLYAVLAAFASLAPAAPVPAADGSLPPVLASAVQSFAAGSYFDVVIGNAVFTAAQMGRRLLLMFYPRVFGMFLLGLWIGRVLLADPGAHRALLARVAIGGVLVGLPLSVVGAPFEGAAFGFGPEGFIETAVKAVAVPALALAYGAGFALLFLQSARIRRAFAPAGQMALTNYLLQSVAGVLVFYGIGLGWFGLVPLVGVLAGAVVFFALQMATSALWLSRARFGPVEWLWRMFTYRQSVPLFR